VAGVAAVSATTTDTSATERGDILHLLIRVPPPTGGDCV
jgi:hypothetical protein